MKLARVAVLLAVLVVLATGAKRKKVGRGMIPVARLERLTDCENFVNNNTRFTMIEFQDLGKGVSMINVDYWTGEHPPPNQNIVVHVKTCKTMDDLNCEHFLKVVVNNCDVLLMKDQFFSSLFAFQPPLLCPYPENTLFRLRNATLDARRFVSYAKMVPPELLNRHLKFRLLFQDAKPPHTDVMCYYIMFKISHVKA